MLSGPEYREINLVVCRNFFRTIRKDFDKIQQYFAYDHTTMNTPVLV